jgi:hypothetical protein
MPIKLVIESEIFKSLPKMMILKNEIGMRNQTTLASDGTPYTGVAPRHISLTGGEIPVEFRVNTEGK